MARIKTDYTGVYYRIAKDRLGASGRNDKCYDIVYKKNGKLVFEKVGWQSEGYTVQDAIELRGQRVKAIRHPDLVQPPEENQPGNAKNATLDEIWLEYKENWLPNIKNGKYAITIYEKYLKPVFGKRSVSSITKLEVEKLKLQLLNTKYDAENILKPSTVKNIISELRRIINKGTAWGLVQTAINPANKIIVNNSDQKRERYLTPKEADLILDGLQFVSCDAHDITKVALYTGLRIREVLHIRGQDIDLVGETIYVPNGKTGSRHAYISEIIMPMLKNRLAKLTSQEQYIFAGRKGKPLDASSITKNFMDVVNSIGLNDGITDDTQRVVFHTLRHTFCSWLAAKGVSLYTIGELVGHKTPSMTQRYAKLSPDSKKQALKKL